MLEILKRHSSIFIEVKYPQSLQYKVFVFSLQEVLPSDAAL